jgi:hypothetical protein
MPNAPVAQLDRALDYESRGQEFESLRARHYTPEHAVTACSRHFSDRTRQGARLLAFD